MNFCKLINTSSNLSNLNECDVSKNNKTSPTRSQSGIHNQIDISEGLKSQILKFSAQQGVANANCIYSGNVVKSVNIPR